MWRLIQFLIALSLMAARAETLEDAVRLLGRRVIDKLAAQERVSVQTRLLDPVSARERDRVDRGLRDALAGHTGTTPTAQLRVTISAGMIQKGACGGVLARRGVCDSNGRVRSVG